MLPTLTLQTPLFSGTFSILSAINSFYDEHHQSCTATPRTTRAGGSTAGEGAAREPKNRWGCNSLFISPQRARRSQRILLGWLCVLRVLCGALLHKNYILTTASSQHNIHFAPPGPLDRLPGFQLKPCFGVKP